MSRFSPPSALRTHELDLASGSLAKPSLRFRREPGTGFYRNGAGRLGFAVNKFRALEVTETDVFARSNSPGAGSASPIAMARANATTADGQETRLDVYEVSTNLARLAAYRQASGKYGWKLYGSTGGSLSGTPDLTVTGDGNLTARGSLVGTSLNVGAGSIAGGAVSGTTGTFTGALSAAGITGTSLNVGGGSIAGGSLNLGSGAITAGAITAASAALSGSLSAGGITGTSLNVGTGGITGGALSASSATIGPSASGVAAQTVIARGAGNYPLVSLQSDQLAASAHLAVQVGASPQFLGIDSGDVSFYTTGNHRLILGTNSARCLTILGNGAINAASALTVEGSLRTNNSLTIAPVVATSELLNHANLTVLPGGTAPTPSGYVYLRYNGIALARIALYPLP